MTSAEDNLFRHMSLKPLKEALEAGSCHTIRVACFDYPTDPKTIQQSFLRFSASSSDWNFGRGFFGVGKPCCRGLFLHKNGAWPGNSVPETRGKKMLTIKDHIFFTYHLLVRCLGVDWKYSPKCWWRIVIFPTGGNHGNRNRIGWQFRVNTGFTRGSSIEA